MSLNLRSAQQWRCLLLLLLPFLLLFLKSEQSTAVAPPLPQTNLNVGLSTILLSQRNSLSPKMDFPGDLSRETEEVIYMTHSRARVWNPSLASFFSWVYFLVLPLNLLICFSHQALFPHFQILPWSSLSLLLLFISWSNFTFKLAHPTL